VEEAVKSGKRDPNTISRLYQGAEETKSRDEAAEKRKRDLEFAACTFKPTL